MANRITSLLLCLLTCLAIGGHPQDRPSGTYGGVAAFDAFGGEDNSLRIEIELTASSNPSQMTVSGQAITQGEDGFPRPVEIRGTYFVNTKKLRAFGEFRGAESVFTLQFDGRRADAGDGFVAVLRYSNRGGEVRSHEFFLGRVAKSASLSLSVQPSKAIFGEILQGKVSVTVSGSGRPVDLTVQGQIAGMRADGQTERRGVGRTVVLKGVGNETRTLDLASLGIRFYGGLDDPKIVIGVRGPSIERAEAASLESDGTPGGVIVTDIEMRWPESPAIGQSVFIAPDFRVVNPSSQTVNPKLTIQYRISRDGGPKRELEPISADATIPANETWIASTSPGLNLGISFAPDAPGKWRVDVEVSGTGVRSAASYIEFDVKPTASTPPSSQRGDIRGSLRIDGSSMELGRTGMVTLGYTLTGRPYAEVREIIELVGPNGAVLASSTRSRGIDENVESLRKWIVNTAEAGTYIVRAAITSEHAKPLETQTSFVVNKKASSGSGVAGGVTPPKVEGSYGLVKREPGNMPADGVGPYGTWSGSIGEGFANVMWTATRDYQGTFTWSAKFPKPPAVLKPGEIIELISESSASRTSENQPFHGGGAKWYVEGAEVLESVSAYSGSSSDGKFHSSAKGKTRFKVGSGGTIVLKANESIGWGTGGNFNTCTYTYQWNAPPIPDSGDPPGREEDDDSGVLTKPSLIPASPDDDESGKLMARLDKSEINLVAGGMSEIVSVYIKGFRKRTEDRVEVVFPSKMDNWASLPGNIVVMGGDGSYYPPNMGRPEHGDGYFFRARSNATTSTQVVDIVIRQKGAGEVRLKLTVKITGRTGGGTTNPPATSGGWGGTWSTNFDDMILTQNGDKVTGKFGVQEFQISGTVTGRVFKFKINDGTEDFGTATLTMSEDGKSFKGEMLLAGSDEKLEWTGTRK